MAERAAYLQAVDRFSDWRWRLNNLYWITDEAGQRVRFEMNWAQEALYDEMHYSNVVLKARQLGFTTFIQIFMLDACLFNSNIRAGTIAHTLDDAEVIFRDKVKYPYDNLPERLRTAVEATQDSAKTLTFANNSSVRVGTSLRSGTHQYLHISEYGKICAKYPEKAREIRTGALNTVHAGQVVWIESTAEGQSGHFYDLCQAAQSRHRMGGPLTQLDWKFFFFPWWKHPAYCLPGEPSLTTENERYFAGLAERGIDLTLEQKHWYVKKSEQQQEDMKREYPSTPEEAFEASLEGAYYSKEITKAEVEKRIGSAPWEPSALVHTGWDLGIGDSTAIWFAQQVANEVRLIDFYENSGEALSHYAKALKERPYVYGDHLVPHDAQARELGTGKSRVEVLESLGIRTTVVPAQSVDDGINAVRLMFPKLWIDRSKCASGLKALKAYRKEWDEKLGTWKAKPLHDWASHPADALRTLAMGLPAERQARRPRQAAIGWQN